MRYEKESGNVINRCYGSLSLLMTGCQSTKGLENDNIKISVYKGVEVDKVDKPSEVTDDDVNTQIQSVLDENATTKEVTDRAVKKGDTATIDFVGKMNGKHLTVDLLQIIHWRSVLILSSKDLKTVLSDTRSVIHLTGTESSRRIMEVLILQAKM